MRENEHFWFIISDLVYKVDQPKATSNEVWEAFHWYSYWYVCLKNLPKYKITYFDLISKTCIQNYSKHVLIFVELWSPCDNTCRL